VNHSEDAFQRYSVRHSDQDDGIESMQDAKHQSNQRFLENLRALYQRRVQSSFKMIDQLELRRSDIQQGARHLQSLERQLVQNQESA
jgi:hypothetical protein